MAQGTYFSKGCHEGSGGVVRESKALSNACINESCSSMMAITQSMLVLFVRMLSPVWSLVDRKGTVKEVHGSSSRQLRVQFRNVGKHLDTAWGVKHLCALSQTLLLQAPTKDPGDCLVRGDCNCMANIGLHATAVVVIVAIRGLVASG
ncbi:uncharacterized protein A4U43_C07F1470 [Asparagus officinalis]|uniref:Uncharacterized protein n=1 Tax=Asparagus officinalis TaxID=4686 RepID=A0A5P1E8G8_ASPOF|nr:uncharacterized protein A4U43_C07F1470 [Asparagus officinalis]